MIIEQGVVHVAPVSSAGDQAEVAEQPQMIRHGGLPSVQELAEFGHSPGLPA